MSTKKQLQNAAKFAANFHRLAPIAARTGGFWVSAAGGTGNVVAGVIACFAGVSFDQALDALNDQAPSADWYVALADAQPWGWDDLDAAEDARWDARDIARAACRRQA